MVWSYSTASGAFADEGVECSHSSNGAVASVVDLEVRGEIPVYSGESDSNYALGCDVQHQVLMPLSVKPLAFVPLRKLIRWGVIVESLLGRALLRGYRGIIKKLEEFADQL